MAIRVGKRLSLRWMMVGVAVAAILMGGWVAWSRHETGPPISALIKVSIPESVHGTQSVPDWQARLSLEIRTQRELIKSASNLSWAIASLPQGTGPMLAAMENPLAWLAGHVRADVVGDTALIRISMPDAPRKDQAAIVNAVANSYIQMTTEFDRSRRQASLKAAESLDASYRQSLHEDRKRLREAEADRVSPEELEELRDGLAVRQDMARRARLAAEERRAELALPPCAELIDVARP